MGISVLLTPPLLVIVVSVVSPAGSALQSQQKLRGEPNMLKTTSPPASLLGTDVLYWRIDFCTISGQYLASWKYLYFIYHYIFIGDYLSQILCYRIEKLFVPFWSESVIYDIIIIHGQFLSLLNVSQGDQRANP